MRHDYLQDKVLAYWLGYDGRTICQDMYSKQMPIAFAVKGANLIDHPLGSNSMYCSSIAWCLSGSTKAIRTQGWLSSVGGFSYNLQLY